MGRTPGPGGPEGCGCSGFCPKTRVGEASDERHNVSRFAFEKVPPESLVIANNDDMKMMIQRLHLYRGRSLQSIFTSSTLPSAP